MKILLKNLQEVWLFANYNLKMGLLISFIFSSCSQGVVPGITYKINLFAIDKD